jgi:hypothetical protein
MNGPRRPPPVRTLPRRFRLQRYRDSTGCGETRTWFRVAQGITWQILTNGRSVVRAVMPVTHSMPAQSRAHALPRFSPRMILDFSYFSLFLVPDGVSKVTADPGAPSASCLGLHRLDANLPAIYCALHPFILGKESEILQQPQIGALSISAKSEAAAVWRRYRKQHGWVEAIEHHPGPAGKVNIQKTRACAPRTSSPVATHPNALAVRCPIQADH